jgi:beta-lactamase regulating signal transducer with metallopeptidase domain
MTPLLLSLPAHLEAFAQLSATAAVSGLWQGIALAVAAALALRLVPRTTATVRFFLWTAVLLSAALLPFLHLPAGAHAASHAQPASLLHLGRAWSLGIAALWLAFSLLRLTQLAVQGIRLRALWRNARPTPASPEVASLLATIPLRHVELCLSAEVDRPSVIGFFSPRILIPDWLFTQLTAPELFQIVLHEAEHLRRADDWLNLLQKLSLALFPLNPALVWIERRLCSERELACDDGVLRVTLAPRVYASCLATLAERRLQYRAGHRSALSLALGALGALGTGAVQTLGRSELSRRVYSILHRPPSLSPARTRAVTAMLAVGLAGCAAELARSPQLVSFTAPVQQTATSTANTLPSPQPWEPTGLTSTPGYQNVVFHSPNPRAHRADLAPQPHMTLLKATMPAASGVPTWSDSPAASAPKAVARTKAPAAHMIQASAKSAPQPAAAKRPAIQRLAQSYVVMTSWTMSESMTDPMTEGMTAPSKAPIGAARGSATGQPGGSPSAARLGITRMTVLVDRIPDRIPQGIPAQATGQSQDQAPTPARSQSRAARRNQAQQVFPQYAAVPTDLGWVIVEL